MNISIALPTYNEEKIVEQKIDQLFDFCKKNLKEYKWNIIVADNGSTDKTIRIVKKQKQKYSKLEYFHLKNLGKGIAIKKAWQNYLSDVNIFMDADLATELKFTLPLIKGIAEEKYDLTIGSRYHKQSQCKRSLIRSMYSKFYNFILRIFFNIKLTDTHCGFKALSKSAVQKIIPKIKNDGLFFDTELLVLARYYNLKIKEIPVNWQEGEERKTKIKIIKTALKYLKEIIKLKYRLL
ncbi:hypothetical protein B6D52_00695 [Candidatus Parcubacteria bacterium 4484_255]|nr:MAG: hypothetical protein B6D52_00695 [Candidatus Parcubacteria bacterium 4484_255]